MTLVNLEITRIVHFSRNSAGLACVVCYHLFITFKTACNGYSSIILISWWTLNCHFFRMQWPFCDHLRILGDLHSAIMFIYATTERKISFITKCNFVWKIIINGLLFNHLIRIHSVLCMFLRLMLLSEWDSVRIEMQI